jgi:hypothetical protein
MVKADKAKIRAVLYAQDNVHDMLHALVTHFNLKEKTNPMTHALIAEQLLKGVELINPPLAQDE